MRFYEFIKRRFSERSTWAAITQGVGSAALFPWPYNLIAALASILTALVPDAPKAPVA